MEFAEPINMKITSQGLWKLITEEMLLTWSQKQIEYEGILYTFVPSMCECACVPCVCAEMTKEMGWNSV